MTLKPDLTTDALATAEAWLERWASHVGNCKGGEACECGLTRARYEAETALAAAREEARPDPRPSPVGREEVARWICRTVRIAQGFKGTAEYTLDDEVHNAWDDWLDEADDLLALFSPADGWRPIETAPKEPRDFGIVLGEPIILGFAPDEEGYTLPSREGYWRPALPRGENGRSYSAGWVSPRDPHVEPPYLQPTHWRPLPAAPPPPGGQG